MHSINQLQELVRQLESKVDEQEKALSEDRGTPAGIRQAYSITKIMQSDWERIDSMDSTVKLQREQLEKLQLHIRKLEGLVETEGLGEYMFW